MKSKLAKLSAAAIFSVIGLCSATANATVALNPNAPLAGQNTIVLDPVTFTVTGNGSVGLIVFEDFFAANAAGCGSSVSSALTVSINGGSNFSIGHNTCTGVFNGTYGLLDPNDLFINVKTADEFAVSIGDLVTISGTATFSGGLPSMNPNFGQVAQLVTEFGCPGCALSGQTALGNAVPEPSSLALVGLVLAGLGFSRRRSA